MRAVFDKLHEVRRSLCEMCAADEPMHDEVIDGNHHHIVGPCAAKEVHVLLGHADDVRDQFANKFNPEQVPRFEWHWRTR